VSLCRESLCNFKKNIAEQPDDLPFFFFFREPVVVTYEIIQ